MSITIYVPGDAAALALGADDVTAAILTTAVKQKIDVDIVRITRFVLAGADD